MESRLKLRDKNLFGKHLGVQSASKYIPEWLPKVRSIILCIYWCK